MNQEEEKLETVEETISDPIAEKLESEKVDTVIDEEFISTILKDDCLDLYKLENLKVKDQSKVFYYVLKKYYQGNDDVDDSTIRKNALKCLKLSCDPENNKIHMPYRLLARKIDNEMLFSFEDKTKRNIFLFLIILGLFILTALGSTYTTLHILSIAHLNKDIDGDTVADLNIDINNDEKEEINIDTNKDDKPDVNIDYRGNRKPIFNVDTNDDGKADFNLINRDTNNDGKCDVNCDVNNDGWPDINLDLDGDGVVDMYIDVDDDNVADLNFDMNKDGTCDVHCDTDKDEKCDEFCLEDTEDVNKNPNGSTALIGNTETDIDTAEFIVSFVDSQLVSISGLFPDDQEEAPGSLSGRVDEEYDYYPKKSFSVENKSPIHVKYNVELVVTENTFVSDNFKYKVSCTHAGLEKDYTTVPKETQFIGGEGIVIPPGVKQECKVTFKLQGVKDYQNYDQGRTFGGFFQIYIVEQYAE